MGRKFPQAHDLHRSPSYSPVRTIITHQCFSTPMNKTSSVTDSSTTNAANVTESASRGTIYPVHAETETSHPIEKIVENYLLALRNIAQTVNIVMPHLAKWQRDEIKKHEKRLAHFIPEVTKNGAQHRIAIESARDFAEISTTLRTLEELHNNKALPVLARSLFMQIFSEFDAFMGALLKTIYLKNQDLLKGISREITLRELFEYGTIDDVKIAMLDKEIETFRRDSYVEQFSNLEKKFQITLKKFDEYPEFIELSQRRNIFTHNDGVVSEQYLSVCEREGWKFDKRPATGETLHVGLDYFGRALRVMSKVAFMLSHTLWLKVFPREHEELHNSINNRIYQCLEHKRWRLAGELGIFALSEPIKKGVSEINLRIRTINIAIGLKFAEQEDEAKRLLNSLDWTASYRDFKLAIYILEDNYEKAVALMLSIGKSGEVLQQSSYYTWPLFHKFRERPEFYSTYERIYGEPYATQVPTDGKSTSVSVAEASPAATEESATASAAAPPVKAARAKRTQVPKSIDSKKITGKPSSSAA